MKKYTIAGIGELLWDILDDVETLGGAPANFTYHVNGLGARGIPVSTVGTDERGRESIAELQQRGVETGAISVIDHCPTGYVSATLDEAGVATYNFPGDVAWDHLQLNNYTKEIQPSLDGVCFGTLAQRSVKSRSVIYQFLDTLPQETLKVFDINLRQSFYSKNIISSSLERANIVKLNDEELAVLSTLLKLEGSERKMLTVLLDNYKLKLVILTRGDRGSVLITPDNYSDHSGASTRVIDTIGAGDAFTAATILGYLEGMDLTEINKRANRLAAYVCSQQGAMPPPPEIQ